MAAQNRRRPAPAVTGNEPSKTDRAGSTIDSGNTTSEVAFQPADPAAWRYWHEAAARWPGADRLYGLARRFVVVSHCWTPPTISFHRTRKQAEKVLADLAEVGCNRRCRSPRCARRHEIVDLRRKPPKSEGAR